MEIKVTDGIKFANQPTLRKEIILDYPSRLEVIQAFLKVVMRGGRDELE